MPSAIGGHCKKPNNDVFKGHAQDVNRSLFGDACFVPDVLKAAFLSAMC